MNSQILNFDIDAKLPIIRVESLPIASNGIVVPNNGHPPQNGFRLIEDYAYKRKKHTASKEGAWKKVGYYHYTEPTPDDLKKKVEYDMDNLDVLWLKEFNNKYADSKYKISEEDFEKVMDRLEKESYFDSKSSGQEVDEDAVCAICDDENSPETNLIILCDICNLGFHQECYGIPYVPEGSWVCRRCLQSPSKNVDCVLCPNKGGGFKQTDNGKWAHVICALWIPEVLFANQVFMEPIDSIDQIPAARWKLTCYICKQKNVGACIQCSKPNCYTPFHVTCANQAKLYMKIVEHNGDVRREAFCDIHTPTNKQIKSGMYLVESDDEDHDSPVFKKKKKEQRERLKETRKILVEKRATAFNKLAEPKISEEKLIEISHLLDKDKKKKLGKDYEQFKIDFIRNIQGYWLEKRRLRNGVPLLKRLQISLRQAPQKKDPKSDEESFEKLRYDLEKARLLLGLVKKRELFKKKLMTLSRDVVEKKLLDIDREKPTNC